MIKRLNNQAVSRRFMAGLAPILLLGCSAGPMSSRIALAQSDAPADSPSEVQPVKHAPMDGQLMFEIMIAELAGRRGQLDVAMAGYLQAASKTDDPRVSERATRLAMYGRRWPEAETAARRWLVLDPEAAEAPQFLAQALMRQGNSTEAADFYIEIIRAASDEDLALRQVQAEVQSAETAEQRVTIMQQVLRAFPDNAVSHLGVALAQLQAGDRPAGLKSVEDALVQDPANTTALLLKTQILLGLGQPDEGFNHLQNALADSPDDIALRLGYSKLLVEAGRYDDVGEQLDIVYENATDTPSTLLTISLLALDSKRLERARTYLTRLKETGEYTDQANYYLARISDQQQDYATAKQFYDAVEGGDLRISSQIRLAELLGKTGEVEEGRERLHRLSAAVANPVMQPQILTAESRLLQTAGRATEAVEVLTGGLERFPDHTDLLYARALAADAAGDPGMMLDDLNTLVGIDPENAHALNALGYHFADKNTELPRAEKLLIKANQLKPNDPAIMDSLGWLRYRQGKFDAAITFLTAAYSLYPDAEIAAHLAEALWLNGNEDDARQLITDALVESPDDDRLLHVMQKYIE